MTSAHSCIAAISIVQSQRTAIFNSTQRTPPHKVKGSVTMSHIVENLSGLDGNFSVSSIVARLSDKITRRRVYNKTHAELSQLSTRELDDLGISRSMISRLSYEAAYGK